MTKRTIKEEIAEMVRQEVDIQVTKNLEGFEKNISMYAQQCINMGNSVNDSANTVENGFKYLTNAREEEHKQRKAFTDKVNKMFGQCVAMLFGCLIFAITAVVCLFIK